MTAFRFSLPAKKRKKKPYNYFYLIKNNYELIAISHALTNYKIVSPHRKQKRNNTTNFSDVEHKSENDQSNQMISIET